jgi:transcriptional/translational regulatory protein YebC/TACO1
MAEAGSVAWQFKRVAYFALPAAGVDSDKIFELAVEAGADDVSIGDDSIEITAPVEAFKAVNDRLTAAGAKPAEAELRLNPTTMVELPPDQSLQVMRIMENLEELDDIQRVYSTLQVTDEAVALLETA